MELKRVMLERRENKLVGGTGRWVIYIEPFEGDVLRF